MCQTLFRARPGRAVGGRFPGVDAAPGEDELLGARAAHHPRQALRATRPGPKSWVGFYMWWLLQPALEMNMIAATHGISPASKPGLQRGRMQAARA